MAAREVRRGSHHFRLLETRFKTLQKRNRLLQRRLTVLSRQLSTLRVQLDRRLAPARQDRQLIPSGQLPSPQEVRFLRRSLGLSRLTFSKKLGVSSGSIFGWETGRTVPRGKNAARIRALADKVAGGRRGTAERASRRRTVGGRARRARR